MNEQRMDTQKASFLDRLIRFCLENKLVVALFVIFVTAWGLMVAPFDWDLGPIPRSPVPTDAIPDIGENQQIVFTEWPGRSPQDVEDQITYPLTVSLLGLPGVKTIRSYSYFGFSSIYVIFKEEIDFYWARSRILEKLASLPAGTLPEGVRPALGPDATALGQIFWYTLEGRDEQGNPTGGWSLDELRSVQDWYVRYALMSADGVSEVASIGGFVREYQVDVDPDAMRHYGVTLEDVYNAVRRSNLDVGARTIEVNRVEYVVRALGFIRKLADLENTVVKVVDNVPVYVKDVAHVTEGPAIRRGALDKEGAEAVGGVVVVRYGENPLRVIKNVKEKIAEIAPGLREKILPDGRKSKVTIVPFYDRTGLIYETLGTLNRALSEEILVTVIVVVVSVLHLHSSILISGLLPLAVLMCFIAMKSFGVDANIVSLSGIAIAIGTMVDMGIVICENILKHMNEADPKESKLEVVYRAASEVGSAVMTAVATTVVSFLPVFTMEQAEGKLFKPLAFTKTFALIASLIVALTVIAPAAHLLFGRRKRRRPHLAGTVLCFAASLGAGYFRFYLLGAAFALMGVYRLVRPVLPAKVLKWESYAANFAVVLVVGYFLAEHWLPLGPERGLVRNGIFVGTLIGSLLLAFYLVRRVYARILRFCLRHKILFLSIPVVLVLFGGTIWLGFDATWGRLLPGPAKKARAAGMNDTAQAEKEEEETFWDRIRAAGRSVFPGLGKEFMPPLDEGSFLLMPTTMPHASIGECLDMLQKQDIAIRSIPEIETVVGKIGRVESALDPAPISMVETVITYKPEYVTDKAGRRVRFKYDEEKGQFVRDEQGRLIPDPHGKPYRQWRDHIRKPADIWEEIKKAAKLPGSTGAPPLQPIAARIVMLQTGMRASMGVKVYGPTLEAVEKVGYAIERFLKEVPSVDASTVFADRVVGKPYLEIEIDREKIARYGLTIKQVAEAIEVAIGGKRLTTTVEGRERYPVRVRFMRELRDQPETLGSILLAGPGKTQIPLREVADIRYVRGPQVIKSENTFLVSYVIFDKKPGYAEVDVVEECKRYLEEKKRSGEFVVPEGVNYRFSGSYENQVRAARKLSVVLPLSLFIIFLILYFQFRSAWTTMLVFSGILVAWAGGFLLIWLYGQNWFLDFSVFGVSMRELFQVHPINLSVAIWVGFLALFGIASDDGVVMCTYLNQRFAGEKFRTVEEVRQATVEAGTRRVRPCLMTTATTILALLPVLTSQGRGADIMVPMAIPSFGGMCIEVLTMFVVPVLYCALKERELRKSQAEAGTDS